jgi:hypothetical protein
MALASACRSSVRSPPTIKFASRTAGRITRAGAGGGLASTTAARASLALLVFGLEAEVGRGPKARDEEQKHWLPAATKLIIALALYAYPTQFYFS